MRGPSSLMQEFLKKWAMGLQISSSSNTEMSILERKKAVKLAADVAMASARTAKTRWSSALIANACKDVGNKALVEGIVGKHQCKRLKRASKRWVMTVCSKRVRSKKILKRCCGVGRVKRSSMAAAAVPEMVKRRTRVLKGLIPGGDSMDESSLMVETLDYIAALGAQVDAMRCVAIATDRMSLIS